jgi:hypothetical protein
MKKMVIQNLPFSISALLLIGICSCDPDDAEQPGAQELDAIDQPSPSAQPGPGEIEANEPETAEVINNRLQSDFNGDGYADLAIGVPRETVDFLVAGAVVVIYGSEDGLDSTYSAPVPSQLWHHDNLLIPGAPGASPDEGDRFGQALAAGDFNGDGIADLAIGAPGDDARSVPGEQNDAGTVTILYGTKDHGLTTQDSQIFDQGSNVDDIAGVAEPGDMFGFALATGDFDNDDIDDLAIGVPGESGKAGSVHVLRGSMDGLTAEDSQLFFQGSLGGLAGTAEPNDRLGEALAAGDFNGDFFDDLVIGVPGEDTNAGQVHVVYGAGDGLAEGGSAIDSPPDEQIWHQTIAGILDVRESNDEFGRALAAGDFDGDEIDDLAIGVPLENLGDDVNAGAVNTIYGSEDEGLTADGNQFWNQDTAGVEGENDAEDRFGAALAAGDMNGDDRDDLAIGVPRENLSSIIDAGAVNVLYGASLGLSSTGDQRWNQNTAGIQETAASFDQFGFALSVGDYDGDEVSDLAVGVPFEDVGAIDDAGSVNTLYGVQAVGLDDIGDQLWHQEIAGVPDNAEEDEQFGAAVPIP